MTGRLAAHVAVWKDFLEGLVRQNNLSRGTGRLSFGEKSGSSDHLVTVEDAISGVKAARPAGMPYVRIAHSGRADLQRRAGAKLIIEDVRTLSMFELEVSFR